MWVGHSIKDIKRMLEDEHGLVEDRHFNISIKHKWLVINVPCSPALTTKLERYGFRTT